MYVLAPPNSVGWLRRHVARGQRASVATTGIIRPGNGRIRAVGPQNMLEVISLPKGISSLARCAEKTNHTKTTVELEFLAPKCIYVSGWFMVSIVHATELLLSGGFT